MCVKPNPCPFPVEFVMSKKGRSLVKLKGYTYYSARRTGPKVQWRCSTNHRSNCNAVLYTVDNKIVTIKKRHNHAPLETEYITSQKGRPLIRLNGFTYCSTRAKGPKVRWRCSTHYPQGCRAAIVTVEDEILTINQDHTHEA
ncbi:unnamed protein product, partial [Iphiclides podalirius]